MKHFTVHHLKTRLVLAALGAAMVSHAQQPAAPAVTPAPAGTFSGTERSLSEDFKKMLAAKETGNSNQLTNDDDVPLWDSAIKNSSTEIPPQVERVLSMIPGTMIE